MMNFAHFRQTKLYDVVIGAPWICASVYVISGHLNAVATAASAETPDPFELRTMVAIASRLALSLFFGLQYIFILTRTVPKGRMETFFPKLVALIGATLGLSFSLLPSGAPNPLLEIASIALIFFGAIAAVYSLYGLGRSFSIMPEARGLITKGAYRFVRHPLYAAELMMIIGVGMQFQLSSSVLLIAALFGFFIIRMRYEEEILTATFPDYAFYARKTKRFIPFVY